MENAPMQTQIEQLMDVVDSVGGHGGILVVFTNDGIVETHTYGKTKKQCDVLAAWLESSFNHIFTKIPFATVFGWGNNGKPQKITQDEWSSLGDNAKSWVKSIGITDSDIEDTQ